MNRRTRTYLEGRFGDHYRREAIPEPPQATAREWGYIPWTADGRTTMIRHQSLVDLGSINSFLEQSRPRHVYYSAGYYDDPGASSMEQKEWSGADLIFDLDADHLPGIDPNEASYTEMLAECKRELQKLLSFLTTDFGFESPTIVFSGGRGYHVHIHEDAVKSLSRTSRREIVDYIRGTGVTLEGITQTQSVRGSGRQTPASKRYLKTQSGWSGRIHSNLMAYIDYLRLCDESTAQDRLQEQKGIGAKKAEAILDVIDSRYDAIKAGNIDVHPAFLSLVSTAIDQAISHHSASIDEPVTTDVNRLIRLPGSLHGGSGLAVCHIQMDELESFNPLSDAIPETFTEMEITIDVPEKTTVEVGEADRTIRSGTARVPEYIGVHLMATGQAQKAAEMTL